MLLAEIHGKHDLAVRDHEDYLTSTVFGHLRYVRPGRFWRELFSRAKTLPIRGVEQRLTTIVGSEYDLAQYQTLDVHFWPTCPGLGEPELAMFFQGGSQRPLVVLVEVKLWSGKSGEGDHDQLMRYLQVADEIVRLRPAPPPDAKVVVTYLTPREALNEVKESLKEYGDSDDNRCRLFRLQWQDMLEAISEALPHEPAFSRAILEDVRKFLRVRRLEYFNGFGRPAGFEGLKPGCGAFYDRRPTFHGFHVAPILQNLDVVRGAW